MCRDAAAKERKRESGEATPTHIWLRLFLLGYATQYITGFAHDQEGHRVTLRPLDPLVLQGVPDQGQIIVITATRPTGGPMRQLVPEPA